MAGFTDFEHFDVAGDLDFASWDSDPLGFLASFPLFSETHRKHFLRSGDPDYVALHHDLYRACGQGRWWVMEQQPGPVNWAPYNPAPLPGMARFWALEASLMVPKWSASSAASPGLEDRKSLRAENLPPARSKNCSALRVLRVDSLPRFAPRSLQWNGESYAAETWVEQVASDLEPVARFEDGQGALFSHERFLYLAGLPDDRWLEGLIKMVAR